MLLSYRAGDTNRIMVDIENVYITLFLWPAFIANCVLGGLFLVTQRSHSKFKCDLGMTFLIVLLFKWRCVNRFTAYCSVTISWRQRTWWRIDSLQSATTSSLVCTVHSHQNPWLSTCIYTSKTACYPTVITRWVMAGIFCHFLVGGSLVDFHLL